MGYSFILWDFDGTLADTFAGTVRVYNRLAAAHGFLPIDDPQAARRLTVRAFLQAHRISLLRLPSLVREMLAGQRGEAADVALFPGVLAVLQDLRRAGRRLAVLSSNAEDNIRACLRANGVEDLFEAVVGYRRLFGKGRAIRKFLRGLGVPAAQALYVGDEVRDVEAARKAGVAVAAVAWGYQARELLARQGPDYLVDAPEKLRALLA